MNAPGARLVFFFPQPLLDRIGFRRGDLDLRGFLRGDLERRGFRRGDLDRRDFRRGDLDFDRHVDLDDFLDRLRLTLLFGFPPEPHFLLFSSTGAGATESSSATIGPHFTTVLLRRQPFVPLPSATKNEPHFESPFKNKTELFKYF